MPSNVQIPDSNGPAAVLEINWNGLRTFFMAFVAWYFYPHTPHPFQDVLIVFAVIAAIGALRFGLVFALQIHAAAQHDIAVARAKSRGVKRRPDRMTDPSKLRDEGLIR